MQIECDLMDDDSLLEFLITDGNVTNESSNSNNEQTPSTFGLPTCIKTKTKIIHLTIKKKYTEKNLTNRGSKNKPSI